MTVAAPPSDASLAVDPVALRRKVFWRIVPLIFVLYIVAYLDRTNISCGQAAYAENLAEEFDQGDF